MTERASGGEVCPNVFKHDPDKLVHGEPQWMLERGARAPAQALRTGAEAADLPPDDKLLVDHARRLGGPKMGIDLEMLGSIRERQDEYAVALEKHEQALSVFQQVGMANEAWIT